MAALLATRCETKAFDVMSWMREPWPVWIRALQKAGYQSGPSKVFVERELTRELPSIGCELTTRTLAECGEAEFCSLMMAASTGDPFEERHGEARDVEAEWADLVTYAGREFDPTHWYVVSDCDGDIGVLLPQAYDKKHGSIFYIGVLPERRRRGFGRALHALGLHTLAARNIPRYVGSTDVRNVGMRTIFESNGCAVKDHQRYFTPPHP